MAPKLHTPSRKKLECTLSQEHETYLSVEEAGCSCLGVRDTCQEAMLEALPRVSAAFAPSLNTHLSNRAASAGGLATPRIT